MCHQLQCCECSDTAPLMLKGRKEINILPNTIVSVYSWLLLYDFDLCYVVLRTIVLSHIEPQADVIAAQSGLISPAYTAVNI